MKIVTVIYELLGPAGRKASRKESDHKVKLKNAPTNLDNATRKLHHSIRIGSASPVDMPTARFEMIGCPTWHSGLILPQGPWYQKNVENLWYDRFKRGADRRINWIRNLAKFLIEWRRRFWRYFLKRRGRELCSWDGKCGFLFDAARLWSSVFFSWKLSFFIFFSFSKHILGRPKTYLTHFWDFLSNCKKLNGGANMFLVSRKRKSNTDQTCLTISKTVVSWVEALNDDGQWERGKIIKATPVEIVPMILIMIISQNHASEFDLSCIELVCVRNTQIFSKGLSWSKYIHLGIIAFPIVRKISPLEDWE